MIDLYNTVYTPTSSQVHGSWNAVGRTALRYCLNPLHRLHMVPDIETTRLDLTSVVSALRILHRSWDVWREWAPDVPASACLPAALAEIAATLDADLAPNAATIDARSQGERQAQGRGEDMAGGGDRWQGMH